MFLVRVIMPYLILSSIAEWYTTKEHYVFLITHLTTFYVTQDSPYATRHCVSPWWIIFVVGGFECSTTRFLWDCRRFHQWWPCSWFGFERHLPWFCAPELACWLCNISERSSMQLVRHHGECEEGLFKVSHLSAWLMTMGGVLEYLVSVFGSGSKGLLKMVVKQGLYAMDRKVNLTPAQELLFYLLECVPGAYSQGTSSHLFLSICPPSCPSAVLSLTSLFQLLSRTTEPQRPEVRDWTVSPTKWDSLMTIAIDAHCHMGMWKRKNTGSVQQPCLMTQFQPT